MQHLIASLCVTAVTLASTMATTTGIRVPKLVAFDLDGTVWSPDMYQLWGGGAPFTVVSDAELRDRAAQRVWLLGSIQGILHELQTGDKWRDTKVAWVSCTDEPTWAAECLRLFKTSEGSPIGTVVHSEQIFKSNKKTHFARLKKEFDIEYTDMLFFDNESGNIRDVAALGVKSVYCPEGMTTEVWEKGLSLFR